MKHYTVWYSQTDTYKIGFDAESLEDAQAKLEAVFEEFEYDMEELPNYWSKLKSVESDYSPETLEEVED